MCYICPLPCYRAGSTKWRLLPPLLPRSLLMKITFLVSCPPHTFRHTLLLWLVLSLISHLFFFNWNLSWTWHLCENEDFYLRMCACVYVCVCVCVCVCVKKRAITLPLALRISCHLISCRPISGQRVHVCLTMVAMSILILNQDQIICHIADILHMYCIVIYTVDMVGYSDLTI